MVVEGGRLGMFSVLSRRRLLGAALGGGAALAAGGVWLRSILGAAPEVEGLRFLSAREHQTLECLARTHLPAAGPFGLGAERFEVARAFDGFLAGEPADNVRDLKRALLLLELGPLIFDHRAAGFSRLSEAERLSHWERWVWSPRLLQRQVALAFRKFMAMVYFDQEAVWPHIGYPGPLVKP